MNHELVLTQAKKEELEQEKTWLARSAHGLAREVLDGRCVAPPEWVAAVLADRLEPGALVLPAHPFGDDRTWAQYDWLDYKADLASESLRSRHIQAFAAMVFGLIADAVEAQR